MQWQELNTQAVQPITFAPGEKRKTVKFKILDDKKSEGTEGFSLLLVNPDNAELYEVTSLSVNIEDDEPKEKALFLSAETVTRQKTEMPLLQ